MKAINDSVVVLTMEEFLGQEQELAGYGRILKAPQEIRYCSANLLDRCVVGTLMIPDKASRTEGGLRCGFYLDEHRLLLVDDGTACIDIFARIQQMGSLKTEDGANMFFAFLEYLIREDPVFLEEYGRKLEEIEMEMTEDKLRLFEDFDVFLSQQRKDLRRMTGYYRLLAEVADVMEEAMRKLDREQSRELFAYLRDKVRRLYHETSQMAEYVLQIRDIHMSKISMRQNQVMQMLTIVTTIFMPLTLIAGWYGMNFVHMPELAWPYGYAFAGALAAVVVAAELAFFKRKKWF